MNTPAFPEKKYTGSCYIALVGGELEYSDARDSIELLQARVGDEKRGIRGTKGYEVRQSHFEYWLTQTDHQFMFLMDTDQRFAPNCLERLRSHGLPYVSGFYLRRRFAPVAPVWFHYTEGNLPSIPWHTVVEPDTLYPLGGSGWGCLLIHREVAEKVGELLKGEHFVIEDDMDIYPYNLDKIMAAVNELGQLKTGSGGLSFSYVLGRLKEIHQALVDEIHPLRGLNDPVGSDVRFPFFAHKAGYVLWGDSGSVAAHMLNYPLQPLDFTTLPAEILEQTKVEAIRSYEAELARTTTRLEQLGRL